MTAPAPWVLIVDDDPVMLQFMETLVGAPGLRVTTAADARQAFIQARDLKPALVISDLLMPGFYGTAALFELRKDPRTAGIPFLFVTGMPPAKAQALLPPNDPKVRLLLKPFDRPQLAAAVRELAGLEISPQPDPEAAP